MAYCKSSEICLVLSNDEVQALEMVLINFDHPLTPEQEKLIDSIKKALKPFWV